MLKSCYYCGRIHEAKLDCGKKPKRKKKCSRGDRFRGTRAWQRKRDEIKKRDKYLCQVCLRNLYDTDRQYNYSSLEVHHAISLENDFDRRLDDSNLITLCERHHELAERGVIPCDEILGIIEEQNRTV